MKILHIDSSILGEGSASRALTREVVAQLRKAHPEAEVAYLDLAAEELPHLSLRHIVVIGVLPSAAGTLDLLVASLAPHPELQTLTALVDFMPVNPIARPLEDFGELVICQAPSSLPLKYSIGSYRPIALRYEFCPRAV